MDENRRRFVEALAMLGVPADEIAKHVRGSADEDAPPNPNATELRAIADGERKHEELEALLRAQMNPKEDDG